MNKINEFLTTCNILGFYTNDNNDEIHISLHHKSNVDDIIMGILSINDNCEIEIGNIYLIVRNRDWI